MAAGGQNSSFATNVGRGSPSSRALLVLELRHRDRLPVGDEPVVVAEQPDEHVAVGDERRADVARRAATGPEGLHRDDLAVVAAVDGVRDGLAVRLQVLGGRAEEHLDHVRLDALHRTKTTRTARLIGAVSPGRPDASTGGESAHLTAHGGGRHIHPMPRAAASDDEQVFRTFLTARGFDDRVMAVAFHLYRTTQEAIARAEAEVLRPLRLSWVGYVTLMGLWVRGSAEVRDLARMQVASKPAVVKSLDGLERRRLVRRRRSDQDRRLVDVELTPAGRALVRKAQREVHRREHRLTGRLTVAEKRELARLLRKLDTTLTGSLTG